MSIIVVTRILQFLEGVIFISTETIRMKPTAPSVIQDSWKTNPDKRTCDACDYKTFCKTSASTKKLSVP
ncbi:hypothetical protein [Methanobacterium formicicum]|uniref:hypothetical protein n=1 Tax=Methanobacterium formicicum TaxID=2162 RepID=UPI0024122ED9|nr:hypothetical protein [Methanobacterium formicicum]MDG3547261.1 hypothetical protein [Methanobacterium formicicum]